ncbi:hypothetical protein [Nocardia sp. NPDC127526]|uniref:hypothetical protein n=1 Tax=Nocardia sp. NPDC127526 TaxID=3345393 RepID=UPI003641C68F
MSFRTGHPLAYPVLMTIGVLVVCAAWAPFVDVEQAGLLGAVALVVVGYSAFRLFVATRTAAGAAAFVAQAAPGKAPEDRHGVIVRRVRQQHRLTSRTWLELDARFRTVWLPVYFDPAFVTLTPARIDVSDRAIHVDGMRVYPSGRLRRTEPVGRLIDNPAQADPDGPVAAVRAGRIGRRLLLDAQSAVVAPFFGLLWVYVAGGGVAAFLAAGLVAGVTATWLAAIRGSDPS